MVTRRRLILAIDPGTEWMGYCLLMPGEPTARRVGAVHAKGRLHFRLGWLQEAVEGLLLEHGAAAPLDCVVEKAIVWGGNLATIALAEARGVILAAIGRKPSARLFEYHASSVKKGVTGKGNAKKWEVAAMVRRLLSITEEGLPFDATDAAALAWYHANRQAAFEAKEGGA